MKKLLLLASVSVFALPITLVQAAPDQPEFGVITDRDTYKPRPPKEMNPATNQHFIQQHYNASASGMAGPPAIDPKNPPGEIGKNPGEGASDGALGIITPPSGTGATPMSKSPPGVEAGKNPSGKPVDDGKSPTAIPDEGTAGAITPPASGAVPMAKSPTGVNAGKNPSGKPVSDNTIGIAVAPGEAGEKPGNSASGVAGPSGATPMAKSPTGVNAGKDPSGKPVSDNTVDIAVAPGNEAGEKPGNSASGVAGPSGATPMAKSPTGVNAGKDPSGKPVSDNTVDIAVAPGEAGEKPGNSASGVAGPSGVTPMGKSPTGVNAGKNPSGKPVSDNTVDIAVAPGNEAGEKPGNSASGVAGPSGATPMGKSPTGVGSAKPGDNKTSNDHGAVGLTTASTRDGNKIPGDKTGGASASGVAGPGNATPMGKSPTGNSGTGKTPEALGNDGAVGMTTADAPLSNKTTVGGIGAVGGIAPAGGLMQYEDPSKASGNAAK